MKIILLFTLIFSGNLFARSSGEIRFGDGSTSVRITVGNNNTHGPDLVKRIKRLERAVSHLQLRVYELEDGGDERQQNFTCSVELCRKSSSIHARSLRNCEFYDLFKKERLSVWAINGGDAERLARKKLANDRDVAFLKESTLSCR